jgi:hypothetical protein
MSDPAHYEIRVKGHLSDLWAGQFGGLAIDNLPNGEALLSGTLPDQAAVHGVLNRILYLGLTLISLNRTDLINLEGNHARIEPETQ